MTEWVDALVFLGESRYGAGPNVALAEELARRPDTSFVCAPAVPPDRDLRGANLRVLEQIRGAAGRSRALARIDPLDPGSAVLARELLGLGCAGVLLDPWRDSYCISACPELGPVVSEAELRGLPVVVEAGFPWVSEPLQVAEFAARHPGIPIVATRGLQMNMSGLAVEAATAALARCPQLHLLTSGVYRQDWLESLVAQGLSERVLFASMAPVFHDGLERARVEALGGDDGARRRIAGENARRVFGLT